MLQRGFYAVE